MMGDELLLKRIPDKYQRLVKISGIYCVITVLEIALINSNVFSL